MGTSNYKLITSLLLIQSNHVVTYCCKYMLFVLKSIILQTTTFNTGDLSFPHPKMFSLQVHCLTTQAFPLVSVFPQLFLCCSYRSWSPSSIFSFHFHVQNLHWNSLFIHSMCPYHFFLLSISLFSKVFNLYSILFLNFLFHIVWFFLLS